MQSQESYRIGPDLRVKLRQMVDDFDGRVMGSGGGKIPTVHQGMMQPGGGSLRLGSITATWNKNSTALVTQLDGDGSMVTPTVEFTAKNWFAQVTVPSGSKKVACASIGGTWTLIAAEC